MKNLGIVAILILTILSSTRCYSQDKTLETTKLEYEEYLRRARREFDDYITRCDKEYALYLKQYWMKYDVSIPIEPDTFPQPVELPIYLPSMPRKTKGETIRLSPDTALMPPVQIQLSVNKENNEIISEGSSSDMLTFFFYGSPVQVKYHPDVLVRIPEVLNEKEIGEYWELVSDSKYQSLLDNLLLERNSMQINDWGWYKLIEKAAQQLYPESPTGSKLLTWFLLSKSGYRTRVAYDGDNLSLLLPFVNKVFGFPFVTFDSLKYYVMDNTKSSFYTCEKDFPSTTKLFDLTIQKPLNIGNLNTTRSIHFEHNDAKYEVTLAVNANSLKFYEEYPLTDIKVIFNSIPSTIFQESLVENLKPLIDGMPATEAAGFLLSFVQKGFPYMTDEEQFGVKEKINFVEQSFSPDSKGIDCEDRSVLYAFLARKLLGLEVIGLHYPGHISCAIHFDQDEKGEDRLIWRGKSFLEADPSFINAPLGMSMPLYRTKQVEIIEINPLQAMQNIACPGFEIAPANSLSNFDIITLLKKETDKMIDAKCEKGIAGFIALINIAKESNISIPGTVLREALDKYNPEFKNLAPEIYENISKIVLIRNFDGIVTIKTREGKPVTFDQVKVFDNAHFKILSLTNGDYRIDILDGIRVGQFVTWFKLNWVRSFNANGNILFDYSNHSQALVNIRKDILSP